MSCSLIDLKFPGDARLVFGVAVRTRQDGEQEGIRCEPYSYTGKTVVGVARFEVEIEKKFHRARGLKGVWGQGGGGYQVRYGLEARMKCIEQVSKKILCITTIMDHVVSESKRVYEGTSRFDDFCIFHDGLSQWWEEGSQNYLHSLGLSRPPAARVRRHQPRHPVFS